MSIALEQSWRVKDTQKRPPRAAFSQVKEKNFQIQLLTIQFHKIIIEAVARRFG